MRQRRIRLWDHAVTTPDDRHGDDTIAGGPEDDMIFGQMGDDWLQGDGTLLDGSFDITFDVLRPVHPPTSPDRDVHCINELGLVARGELDLVVLTDDGPLHVEKSVARTDVTPAEYVDGDTSPLVVPVGTGITFEYVVSMTDTEPVAITGVVEDNGTPDVADDDFEPVAVVDQDVAGNVNIGDTDGDGLLDAGEQWRYARPAGLDPVAVEGLQVNIVRVTAGAESASDLAYVYGTNGIRLDVTLNGAARPTPPGADIEPAPALVWSYELRNETTGELSGVTVRDDGGPGASFDPSLVSGDEDGDGNLDPDEVWTYSADVVAASAGGDHVNTATAQAAATTGCGLTDTARSYYTVAGLPVTE